MKKERGGATTRGNKRRNASIVSLLLLLRRRCYGAHRGRHLVAQAAAPARGPNGHWRKSFTISLMVAVGAHNSRGGALICCGC